MPSEFWYNVDPEWYEIHPDLIEEVFSDLLGELEARGYIGPRGGGGGGIREPPQLPGIDDDDDDEPPPPRKRRRRRRQRVTTPVSIPKRIGRFFRRLFGG